MSCSKWFITCYCKHHDLSNSNYITPVAVHEWFNFSKRDVVFKKKERISFFFFFFLHFVPVSMKQVIKICYFSTKLFVYIALMAHNFFSLFTFGIHLVQAVSPVSLAWKLAAALCETILTSVCVCRGTLNYHSQTSMPRSKNYAPLYFIMLYQEFAIMCELNNATITASTCFKRFLHVYSVFLHVYSVCNHERLYKPSHEISPI